MALSTGKTAEVMLEKFKETYESQQSLLPLVDFHEPPAGSMQNASNVIWYPVQQQAPVIAGWDLSDTETGIIEETYPAVLGVPSNDFVQMRADDLRDQRFWERRAEQSSRRQASELNSGIASAIVVQGSLFYRSNATSGYEFIAEAQALMNERQLNQTQRNFVLNDRDNLLFGTDLAARQTLQGKPAETWVNGQIGKNIAGFDVFTGSFLPNITGAADPVVTIDADQVFVPSGGSVNAVTHVVTNVDYREASLLINDSTLLAVGDKFTIENGAVVIQSIGLGDKNPSGQAMVFTVIELTDPTHIKIYPKPIAANQAGISTLEAAYANINTAILNTATITRLNIDATNKTNIFWDKSAVEVIGGTIPAELFKQFDGMKVITDTMANGLRVYMIYDGDIATMNFRFRIFTWYGITVSNPSNCGAAVTF
ncbi:MAG: P22 phage major capsid protein family protein [Candidatus Heimdallarchaeaceae archaeon]